MPTRTILAPEEVDAFRRINESDRSYANSLLCIYVREGATCPYLRQTLGLSERSLRRRLTGK